MKKSDLPQNQLLGSLLANNAEDTIAHQGYIAYNGTEDSILLYPSIYNLSKSFEIKVADILYSAPAPESVLPFGGVILWLKKDSEIIARHALQEGEDHVSSNEIEPADEKSVNINADRLNISVEQANLTLGAVRAPNHPCR
jgi:hypothetical protein